MSARISKEVTDRVRSGRYLLSAFEIESPRVADAFLDATAPHLEAGEDEARPDGVLTAIEGTLRASLRELVETDFDVAEAAGRESVLRQRHQAEKRQLAFQIVALRRMVLGQYVAPDLANLGLEAMNVRDSATVLRRAELVAQRFAAVPLPKLLGEPRFAGANVDLGGVVAEIRDGSASLLARRDEIDEAQRATDRARRKRNRAREAYDRIYLRSARIFEDLCRFCGLDPLAGRVRKSPRRPPEIDEVPEDPISETRVREIAIAETTGIAPQGRAVGEGEHSEEERGTEERGTEERGTEEPADPAPADVDRQDGIHGADPRRKRHRQGEPGDPAAPSHSPQGVMSRAEALRPSDESRCGGLDRAGALALGGQIASRDDQDIRHIRR